MEIGMVGKNKASETGSKKASSKKTGKLFNFRRKKKDHSEAPLETYNNKDHSEAPLKTYNNQEAFNEAVALLYEKSGTTDYKGFLLSKSVMIEGLRKAADYNIPTEAHIKEIMSKIKRAREVQNQGMLVCLDWDMTATKEHMHQFFSRNIEDVMQPLPLQEGLKTLEGKGEYLEVAEYTRESLTEEQRTEARKAIDEKIGGRKEIFAARKGFVDFIKAQLQDTPPSMVAIASFSNYPEAILYQLEKSDLSPEEVSRVKIISGFPENGIASNDSATDEKPFNGKEDHISRARKAFGLGTDHPTILMDDKKENIEVHVMHHGESRAIHLDNGKGHGTPEWFKEQSAHINKEKVAILKDGGIEPPKTKDLEVKSPPEKHAQKKPPEEVIYQEFPVHEPQEENKEIEDHYATIDKSTKTKVETEPDAPVLPTREYKTQLMEKLRSEEFAKLIAGGKSLEEAIEEFDGIDQSFKSTAVEIAKSTEFAQHAQKVIDPANEVLYADLEHMGGGDTVSSTPNDGTLYAEVGAKTPAEIVKEMTAEQQEFAKNVLTSDNYNYYATNLDVCEKLGLSAAAASLKAFQEHNNGEYKTHDITPEQIGAYSVVKKAEVKEARNAFIEEKKAEEANRQKATREAENKLKRNQAVAEFKKEEESFQKTYKHETHLRKMKKKVEECKGDIFEAAEKYKTELKGGDAEYYAAAYISEARRYAGKFKNKEDNEAAKAVHSGYSKAHSTEHDKKVCPIRIEDIIQARKDLDCSISPEMAQKIAANKKMVTTKNTTHSMQQALQGNRGQEEKATERKNDETGIRPRSGSTKEKAELFEALARKGKEGMEDQQKRPPVPSRSTKPTLANNQNQRNL